MAGEVAFFELGVEDVGRGRAFYEGLFGWRFERGPSGQGWAIETGTVPGGMHGGDKGAAPYLFFRVDDMEAALARVRQLGGTVEDMDVEGDEASVARWGRLSCAVTIRGRRSGMHQPPVSAS